jgi:hypothetical protein
LWQKLHLLYAGGAVCLDLPEIRHEHPLDQTPELDDLGLGFQIEVPERCGPSPQDVANDTFAELNRMPSQDKKVRLKGIGPIPHKLPGPGASVAHCTYDIDEAAVVPERSCRSKNGRFGLSGSSSSEYYDAHSGSIAAPCTSLS